MKTIHKLLLIATIALGLGFVACNDADDLSPVDDSKANTHVSVTLKLSTNASTRALPDDYNSIGYWAGKDKIENITVYLVDGLSVTAKTFLVGSDKDYVVATVGADKKLIPNKESAAIKTTVGTKKVYVLINAKTPVTDHLAKTKVEEFEKAYQETALALTNSGTSKINIIDDRLKRLIFRRNFEYQPLLYLRFSDCFKDCTKLWRCAV